MLAPNTILRERYRIINQLGHGGMGAVYQAMDENLSCVVAVKETFATNDEQRRAFRREAQLLANLSHPTLPKVMDHFTHGEGQFLVMQFVPGHDLAELLKLREQPFSVAKVIEWADQILDALEELHSSDPPIVHRDIKPSNLKLTPKDKILLLDFGLAKGAAGQMSTADADSHGKSIYGFTPNYAPLEQIRGAGTDPRSDLYSLAATLWTLLTCKVPPDALSRVGEKEEGNPDPLRPAHEINPQVSAAVSSALNQAMAINRNQRQASAAELRNALREARAAEFERSTLPMEERPPVPSIPPAAPSLEPTVKTPEPASLPSSPPLGSTIKAPEPELPKRPFNDKQVDTIRVDSPPAVPSWQEGMAPATAASFVGEAQRRPWKPAALIVASVLVVAISIGLVAWSGWRPWAREQQANDATKTNQQAAPGTTNLSLSNKTPVGMVSVSGGEFMMGRDEKDGGDEYERPAHKVTVKPFFMDQYEVTNEDYAKFVKATGHRAPSNWVNGSYSLGAARKPVTGVNWDDATAYAKWAGKRLPTEEEYEFAARGTDGRLYPWGNDWQTGSANADGASNGTVDVGTYKGTSPFGAYDMVGNAWQWTASRLTAYPGGSIPGQNVGANLRVIRGGTYASKASQATATYRRGWPATGADNYNNTGFRCVEDVKR